MVMKLIDGRKVKHRWTDDEREIVRRDYRGTRQSAGEIAGRLGVTFLAVKGQVQNMGISFHRRHQWTATEEHYLTENITSLSINVLSKRLHMSPTQVVMKSKKMRLSRKPRDSWYTMRDVCEILGIDHHRVGGYIDCGALKASYHNGLRPGHDGSSMWHIDEADLRDFIIAHSFEFVGRNVDLFQIIQIIIATTKG